MDPLSALLGAVTLIQATSQTISVIRTLHSKVKNARKEQEEVLRRLFDLTSILGQISAFRGSLSDQSGNVLDPSVARPDTHDGSEELAKMKSSLSHCENHLKELNKSLEEMQSKKFVWVCKSESLQKSLDRIKIDIETLNTIFQNTMLSSILHSTSRVDDIADGMQALVLREKHQKMFSWLNAESCSSNYALARQKCKTDTGQWFLESEAFSRWKDHPQTIWLHGVSGCGKTILCSTAIEHLRYEYGQDHETGIIYFFFDFQDVRKQHPRDLLKFLLEQLAAENENAIDSLQDLFRSCRGGQDTPTHDQLIKACTEAAGSYGDVFIIIDALDECQHSELAELGATLKALQNGIDGAHIMTFSQPTQGIRELMGSLARQTVSIEGLHVEEDIGLYVRDRLHGSKGLILFSADHLQKVEARLIKASGGMFRWVQLQIDELERCDNLRDLETQLSALPDGLDASYEKILSRLTRKQKGKAIHILTCLSMAPRTLKVSEVANSLQLEPDAETRIASDLKPRPEVVTNMLSGLVVVNVLGKFNSVKNEFDGDIRLAHSSVRDYLFSEVIRQSPMSDFAMGNATGHLFMAKLCVACLLHYNKGPASRQDLQETPFLSYAADNLMPHARAANDCNERNTLDELLVELFDLKNPAFINWHRFCDPYTTRRFWTDDPTHLFTPLHHAVRWNLWRVAQKLIESGAGVRSNDNQGTWSPIHHAAEGESLECINLLVDRKADINARAFGSKTPLHFISEVPYDSGATAACLIERGADLEFRQADRIGTPLQQAAHQGRLAIIETFLKKGANPNAVYEHDRISSFKFGTAMQCAAYWGHLAALELLYRHGADIDQKAADIGTALHAAAINGKVETVEFLVEHGADVRIHAGRLGSVLTAAYYGGSRSIVRTILERLGIYQDDATITRKIEETGNDKCWNLFEAARRNALRRIQSLLDDEGVDINIRSYLSGEYPIILAAVQGHFEAVQLLAETGANLQSRNRGGQRPLHIAASRGDRRMVEVLLRHGALADVRDDHDMSVADVAEEAGYFEIVEYLSAHEQGARKV